MRQKKPFQMITRNKPKRDFRIRIKTQQTDFFYTYISFNFLEAKKKRKREILSVYSYFFAIANDK